MDRAGAIALLDALHRAQNEFYAGGEGAPLRELVTPDITWIVPGDNHIAGSYHGIDAVFDYFRRRREFAKRQASGCIAETCSSATVTDWPR